MFRANVYRYEIPLVKTLEFAWGSLEVRKGLLLGLTDDNDITSWGEIAPLEGYSLETLEEAEEELLRCVSNLEREELFETSRLLPSVSFGIESALAGCDRMNIFPSKWPCCMLMPEGELGFGLDDIDVASSFTAMKLKASDDPESTANDVKVLRTLYPDREIRVDVNRRWTFEEALIFQDALEEAEVDVVEEPCNDFERYHELTLPVALDESLTEISIVDIFAIKNLSAVIIKPTLLGGRQKIKALLDYCRSENIPVIFSSCFESGVGLRHITRMAKDFGQHEVPGGFDTLRFLSYDITEPSLEISKGVLFTNNIFGVDTSKLEKIY